MQQRQYRLHSSVRFAESYLYRTTYIRSMYTKLISYPYYNIVGTRVLNSNTTIRCFRNFLLTTRLHMAAKTRPNTLRVYCVSYFSDKIQTNSTKHSIITSLYIYFIVVLKFKVANFEVNYTLAVLLFLSYCVFCVYPRVQWHAQCL